MPVLRWPHDNHRNVRARLNATISADRDADHDQDRHLMTLMAPASIVTAVCSNGWSMAGNDGARQNRTAKVPSQHDCAVIELRAASGPASILASLACIHCRCQHLRAHAPATAPTNSPEIPLIRRVPWSPRFRSLAAFGRRPWLRWGTSLSSRP